MKRPTKARILGKDWKIDWSNAKLSNTDAGEMIQIDLTIRVDGNMPRDHAREILLHELVHAIDDENHLRMGETRVDRIARYLLQIVRDNPELRRYIFDD